MNNILDYENDNQSTKFTKLSFRNFLVVLVGVVVFLICILYKKLHWIRGDHFQILTTISILIILIFSTLGLIRSIRSFRNQEPNSAKKYIGLVGNLVFALFWVVVIIVNVLDVVRWFNG